MGREGADEDEMPPTVRAPTARPPAEERSGVFESVRPEEAVLVDGSLWDPRSARALRPAGGP